MSIMIPPIHLGKPATPWDRNDPAAEDEFYRQHANPPFSRLFRRLRGSRANGRRRGADHRTCHGAAERSHPAGPGPARHCHP